MSAQDTLATVAECDERIAQAQYVLDHPDEYDVEARVNADKSRRRWQRERRYASRLARLEEGLREARGHLRPEIGGRFDQHAAVAAIDRALADQGGAA